MPKDNRIRLDPAILDKAAAIADLMNLPGGKRAAIELVFRTYADQYFGSDASLMVGVDGQVYRQVEIAKPEADDGLIVGAYGRLYRQVKAPGMVIQ